MSMRMLIDARHREETRVAVVKGNRVEEFDFESEEHKQLKGNIYLAKVTRVEPSLQAAFIDYGGNRHGFLAFSEIHPDYYQIPKEDREALLREEAEHAAEEEALRAREDDAGYDDAVDGADDPDAPEGGFDDLDAAEDYDDEGEPVDAPAPRRQAGGSEDAAAVEVLRQKRMNLRRRYKIQDVIRRRQVLLVQVVKEERGNKGAALTTYLSLAGRYCVLMPNTSHGGGISRKISNAADRKRLKSIMAELDLPKTMGCIVRTAGLQRSGQEIRRDFDYLARLWDEIRENTLASAAPAEVYRDSDLLKRAIRDIYSKDIDEVIVEGEEGYHAARSFMKLLMPSHARKIAPYSDAVPLFQRFGVEDQLGAMYQPVVQLKSGGYLVINPTEALVSIDINSGRSTREHNVEQTALNTNLEAAHEIARQLRLRDMAGLVVIDFIDMEQSSNNRKVEKAIKEALKNDRARIQVGRISSFGLFEMSRQRLRTGVLEASTRICPHCEGSGFIRTASSSGLSALRMLEEEAARGRGSQLRLRASQEAAFYVLNRKRAELADIEDRYGVEIEIESDGTPEGARMGVESGGPPPMHAPKLPAPVERESDEDLPEEFEDEDAGEPIEAARDRDDAGEGDGRRRRRRRRRGGRRDDSVAASDSETAFEDDAESDADVGETDEAAAAEDDAPAFEEAIADGQERRSRGRRGRRGGRRGRREGGDPVAVDAPSAEDVVEAEAASYGVETLVNPAAADDAVAASADEAIPADALAPGLAPEPEPEPKPRRRPRARKVDPVADVQPVEAAPLADALLTEDAPAPRRRRAKSVVVEGEAATDAKPKRTRRKATVADDAPVEEAAVETPALAEPVIASEVPVQAASPDAEPASDEAGASPRRGWWQRTFGA